jgi:hypothetical protein
VIAYRDSLQDKSSDGKEEWKEKDLEPRDSWLRMILMALLGICVGLLILILIFCLVMLVSRILN